MERPTIEREITCCAGEEPFYAHGAAATGRGEAPAARRAASCCRPAAEPADEAPANQAAACCDPGCCDAGRYTDEALAAGAAGAAACCAPSCCATA